MEEAREKCGVFGVASRVGDASEIAYIALYSLQHRGQESAGIGTSQDGKIFLHKDMGTVDWVFRKQVPIEDRVDFMLFRKDIPREELIQQAERFEQKWRETPLKRLFGNIAVGHTRYSTTGESGKKNIHPILFYFRGKPALVVHNGNLVRLPKLLDAIYARGDYVFEGTTDTEVIAALISSSPQENFYDALCETLPLLEGAFSLIFLYQDTLYAVKDRFGLRPLCLGKTGNSFLAASESCAIDTLEGEFLKELEPGEGAILRPDSIKYFHWTKDASWKSCIFEFIYFSRPDTFFRGRRIHEVRKKLGRLLAQHYPVDADVVISVPDSGNSPALGYAEELSLSMGESLFDYGLIRPHQVGRTFIEPVAERRHEFQRLKHNPIPDVIAGKRVVVVDDSIVRGTTIPHVLRVLKRFGAKELHLRISSPPLRFPCHLGIDLPFKNDLIAHQKTVEEIRQEIERRSGVHIDSLEYLEIADLINGVGLPADSFCLGCFSNNYPVSPDSPEVKYP